MQQDRELMAAWRCGDPEGAREVVARHYPRILNLFYRLTGRRDQAEELTQEVFMRLTRVAAAGAQVENLSAWLHRAALNLWRDIARHEITGRSKGIVDGGGDEELARFPAPDEVEELVIAAGEREALRKAVLTLPPPQREVLVLHYYQGLSYEDVAALTAVPVGTVRSRIHYAIRHLRVQLGPAAERGNAAWQSKSPD